jgi:hypothetical protein
METTFSSEILMDFQRTIRHYVPEYRNFRHHPCESPAFLVLISERLHTIMYHNSSTFAYRLHRSRRIIWNGEQFGEWRHIRGRAYFKRISLHRAETLKRGQSSPGFHTCQRKFTHCVYLLLPSDR